MSKNGKSWKVKTWHFAEAVSFFVFLVLAPVGLTEFARESKDQAGLQVQHEAQQQEIDALKAQIAILIKQAEKTWGNKRQGFLFNPRIAV